MNNILTRVHVSLFYCNESLCFSHIFLRKIGFVIYAPFCESAITLTGTLKQKFIASTILGLVFNCSVVSIYLVEHAETCHQIYSHELPSSKYMTV